MTALLEYHFTRHPLRVAESSISAEFIDMEHATYGRIPGQLWQRVAEGRRRD